METNQTQNVRRRRSDRHTQSGLQPVGSSPVSQRPDGYPAVSGQQAKWNSGNLPMQDGFLPAPGFSSAALYPSQQTYQATQNPNRWQTNPDYIPQQDLRQPWQSAPRAVDVRRKKASKSTRLIRWTLILLLCAGTLTGAAYGLTRLAEQHRISVALSPYNSTYCEGVYVDGIHLGGMTQQEARQAVTDHAMSRLSWSVQLSLDESFLREITIADIGYTLDVENALRVAWEQGHTGTQQERFAAMEALREKNFYASSITVGSDTSVIDAILARIASSYYVAPQDAVLLAFDANRTFPFIIQDEVVGQWVDIEPVKASIYQMLENMESGELKLTTSYMQPEVTAAWLKENLLTVRGTATTRISSTSTENRNNNIRRAFELVAGTIVEPGKVFSFNDTVGERTVKNGFFEATEYVYQDLRTGIGGGVCQASTTIYQAAIRAGLEILERRPHSMTVGYTEKGKDATVYWYSNHKIDLKFRNNTNHPLYITAAVQSNVGGGSKLYANVTIYGASLGNVTYDFAVDEIEIPAPEEPEIVKDKKGEYVLYTDEQYVYREASSGWQVDSYRVTYVDGAEVSRTFLYEDIYKEKAQQIYVGIQNPPPEETPATP